MAQQYGSEPAARQVVPKTKVVGTLMHELIHLSGRVIHESAGECALTFRAENIFRWLIYHKYRGAAESICCFRIPGTQPHDELWNFDGIVFLEDVCD